MDFIYSRELKMLKYLVISKYSEVTIVKKRGHYTSEKQIERTPLGWEDRK